MSQQAQEFQMIKTMMQRIKLDTLLKDQFLHVLHMPISEDAGGKDIKVIFSKHQTIGFVFDQVLYIDPDFYKGGKYYNAFYEKEANLIVTTYRLKKHMPLEMDALLAPVMDRLLELQAEAATEVNFEKMELINVEAEECAGKLQNDHATKIFNEINGKFIKMKELVSPGQSDKVKRLEDLLEQSKTIKNEAEFAPILAECNDILKGLDGEEKEKCKTLLLERLGKLHEAFDEDEEEEERLRKQNEVKEKEAANKKYIEVIKKADHLFDAKKYEKSLELYIEALDLKKEMSHPKKRIEHINKLLKK